MLTYLRGRLPLARWLFWFCIVNGVLAGLISLRFLSPVELGSHTITPLFLVSQWIAHYGAFALLVWLLMLPFVWLLPGRRMLQAVVVVGFSCALLALLIDSFIYLQYRFHFNRFILDLILNDTDGQIFDFSWLSWLLLALAVLAIVLVEFALLLWLERLLSRRADLPGAGWMLMLGFLITILSHGVHIWADANAYSPVTRFSKLLPLAHPATAYKQMRKWGWADPDAHQNRDLLLAKTGRSALDYPKGGGALSCQAPKKPLNLLMVVIDSWRADMLYVKEMPNLSRFASKGLRFDNHYSGSNSTRAGIFSLFYSLPSAYWQAVKDSQTPPVLIDQLLKQNYQMGIFASAKLDNPRFNRTVFQPIRDLRLRSDGRSPWERDQNLTIDWQRWYSEQRDPGRPYFGFLFFDGPHGVSFPPDYPKPFTPSWERVDHMRLNKGFDRTPYFNRYRNAIHYTDSLLGPLLADLERDGALENTVVMITGDHGEEFNDNGLGYWGHNGNFSPVQVQVPFVLLWPGRTAEGTATQRWTSHFDLVPTLMKDLLGCSDAPERYALGGNLFEVDHPWLLVSSYSQYAILESERITAVDPVGNYTLFDRNYRSLPDAELNHGVILQAVQQLTAFYRR